jgi:hypothetical protein
VTATFKLFSGALKAYTDKESGRKRVRCTASSTVEDLHGDEIDVSCVMSMANQAMAKGMTIFLNHEYKVPEDIFGKTIHAQAQKQGTDPKSLKDVWDLDLDTEVNESNPRAIETWEAIQGGITVGVSIGAMIRDWEFRDAKKQWEGGLLIKDVELLEASMVGIPANPRSWVKQAARSIRRSYKSDEATGLLVFSGSATGEAIDIATEDDDDFLKQLLPDRPGSMTVGEDGPEIIGLSSGPAPDTTKEKWSSAYINNLPDSAFACIDSGGTKDSDGKTTPRSKRHYPHHNSGGGLDQAHLNNALSRLGDSSNTQCGAAHLRRHKGSAKTADAEGEYVETWDGHDDDIEETEEVTDAALAASAENLGLDASATPVVANSSESVTDDKVASTSVLETPSDEDDESDSEAEVDDEETTSSVDLEAAKSIVGSLSVAEDQDPLLDVLLGIVENAATEVKDLRTQLSTLKTLADSVPALTAERDQVRADLDEAMEVLQLLAKAPLARKATLRSVIADRHAGLTQRLAGGPYDARFLQLIDESTQETE